MDERTPLIGQNNHVPSNGGSSENCVPPKGTLGTITCDFHQNPNSAGTVVVPAQNQGPPFLNRLRRIVVPKKLINSFLAVSTVIFMVAYQVAIPLYTGAFSAPETGSDAYIALLLGQLWIPLIFFIQVFFVKTCIDGRIALKPQAAWSNLFITGFTMALNGVLLGLTSPPDRTPPQLQGLLQTLLIPSTVIARFIVMRKGISRSQLVCIMCLFAGLLISLEPTIFGIDQSDGATSSKSPWYFTVLFGLSWLPAAFGYVFVERGQAGTDDSLVYMAWFQVFLYSSYIMMSWVDFIPGFGMAHHPQDFLEKLKRGFICFYGADPNCSYVPVTAAAYILAFVFGNMFNLLLIRYAESAVYSVVVLALVTPLSTIFWTLFSPKPTLHWKPMINGSTIYLLVGLAIMTPSVVMYTIFSSEPVVSDVPLESVDGRAGAKAAGKGEKGVAIGSGGNEDNLSQPIRRVYSAPSMEPIRET